MCGIALIISGASIDTSSLPTDSGIGCRSPASHDEVKDPIFLVDDLVTVLKRRGPDSLGCKEICLYPKVDTSSDVVECDASARRFTVHEVVSSGEESEITGECNRSYGSQVIPDTAVKMLFVGAVLHLRGSKIAAQPLEDTKNNFLLFNGEIFDGMDIGADKNDTEALIHALDDCCSCCSNVHLASCPSTGKRKTVPEVLSSLRGPWAFIYWQVSLYIREIIEENMVWSRCFWKA